MQSLKLNSGGKTEAVKNFPAGFPDVLTARGRPLVYTRENSKNFEYIGMPVGGLCAGQLYLGGDGKLWFWDIFNLNHRIGQLKGAEAYMFPYVRSRPNEKGARAIEQRFGIAVIDGDSRVYKTLDRDGIAEIEFLGQYPIGEVKYADPELPVEVRLEAFSPFIPLDLENSILPATILNFTVRNAADRPVTVELYGRLENPVLIESRRKPGLRGRLQNRVLKPKGKGLRLVCSAAAPDAGMPERADILFEDFEQGYGKWLVEGDAFTSEGKPYYHQQPLRAFLGKRLADSMKGDRKHYGDGARGKLTSQPFRINRRYIHCLVGGGDHPGKTCINIVVDGKVVASATGQNSETLRPVALDVSAYEGREAVIEIVDDRAGSWGHTLIDHIVFSDRGHETAPLDALPDYGTMTLTVFGSTGDTFADPKQPQEQDLAEASPLVGRLGQRFRLAPGGAETVTFLVTWHFPTTFVLDGKPEQRYYAHRFADAPAVADYVLENFDYLVSITRLWRATWYDSTLPYWFLDRTFLNASILASSTAHLLRDGLFYGFEGGYQGPGTCTHVWAYVQAMGRLFPTLEKSLRERVDFRPVGEGGALREDGIIKFRWFTNHQLAVDGQSGCILKTYLCHQMSADDSFLRRVYSGVKRAMQGLTEARDADHDGILTGPQHNTLDADWYGKIAWLSLYYTAALRAMACMADEVRDEEYARFCRDTADRGRQYIETKLFNGEYFIQEPDPERPDSPGIYTGLEYSQLLGQSWAYQVGLGPILDPAKTSTALHSMWRYNFTTDVGPFRAVHRGGRWFAMPGEGGLIACTWPRGGSEVLRHGNRHFADYNNECQNGYEYAATSLMMWHGMPYHSLTHIWFMHNDRYHGSKRNPWCEVEWGVHYSRSMASYGHFIAACGFRYHGPRGFIAFAPKITPGDFRAAFTAAEGWGTFSQRDEADGRKAWIAVRWGRLRLVTIELEFRRAPRSVEVAVDGRPHPASSTFAGGRLTIRLAEAVNLPAGSELEVVIRG